MAGIQARQAEVLKGHSQWLEENDRAFARHREMMAEMDDKLNGVIAILDDMIRRDKGRQ